MLIALVVVYALVLGVSPGLCLIAIALTVLALDRHDISIVDSLRDRITATKTEAR
jgi:hypothetical protein